MQNKTILLAKTAGTIGSNFVMREWLNSEIL